MIFKSTQCLLMATLLSPSQRRLAPTRLSPQLRAGLTARLGRRLMHRGPTPASGFTLVELLVGLVWGGVILGVLGGSLLVAQLRVAATLQSSIETADSANRTIDLIRKEIVYSGVLNTTFSLATPTSPTTDCDDNLTSLSLIRGPTMICYKSLPLSSLPSQYQNSFQGPCVLVRVGPAFQANGDTPHDAPITATVLMDRLVRSDFPNDCKRALTATVGEAESQTLAKSRNATITLFVANPGTVLVGGVPQAKPSSAYQFSAAVPSNPAFSGLDLYAVANCSTEDGCDPMSPTTAHFKPQERDGTEETFDPRVASKENILYLKYPFSTYTLQGLSTSSGGCSYAGCRIIRDGTTNINARRMDALVFTDRELRLPS